ncbi:uncharacterized protein LOC114355425 [Pelobates cultripes]|uniref:Uncharacterized protein LOC114355425 n=1 Tax=Pelobates cultripes TaxID=61616 RepID=A0AAD1TP27_PELCU|nr:uncharacterized protein LOC114355425 [Pelobates cultripes]
MYVLSQGLVISLPPPSKTVKSPQKLLTEGRLPPRLSFDSDLESTLTETKTQIENSRQLLKSFSRDQENEDINIMKEMLRNQTDLLDRTHKTLSHMSKELDINVTNFDNLQRQIINLGSATDILWKATNQKDLDFTLKEERENEIAQRLSCENGQARSEIGKGQLDILKLAKLIKDLPKYDEKRGPFYNMSVFEGEMNKRQFDDVVATRGLLIWLPTSLSEWVKVKLIDVLEEKSSEKPRVELEELFPNNTQRLLMVVQCATGVENFQFSTLDSFKMEKNDDICVCANLWNKAWNLITDTEPSAMSKEQHKQSVTEFVSRIAGLPNEIKLRAFDSPTVDCAATEIMKSLQLLQKKNTETAKIFSFTDTLFSRDTSAGLAPINYVSCEEGRGRYENNNRNGHFRGRSMYKPQNYQGIRNYSAPSQDRYYRVSQNSPMICYKCNQEGHVRRYCPKNEEQSYTVKGRENGIVPGYKNLQRVAAVETENTSSNPPQISNPYEECRRMLNAIEMKVEAVTSPQVNSAYHTNK